MFYGTKFNQDLSGWCVPLISSEHSGFSANSPLSNENKPIWGTCNSQATLTLTSSDSDNIITSGVVTVTATFSENMAATPLISIAGLVTNTTMTQGSSAAEWTYYWQVPSSVSTGTYAVTLSATDTYSRPYAGSESLDLSIDTMFYLDANGVTIKCKGCSAGDTGYIGNVLYTAHDNTSIAEKPRSDSDWDRVVTTLVTDMSELFMAEVINGQVNPIPDGISSWDTSNVTSFEDMFRNYNSSNYSGFNQDISKWNTSSATTMQGMFTHQDSFDSDISSWDTSNVTDMSDMFAYAHEFNQNIGNWDVSSVTNMSTMFFDADEFNNGEDVPVGAKDASDNNNPLNWDVSNVTTMYRMFSAAINFNQDISFWDVTKVETVEEMFEGAYQFNCDISVWDVSNIRNFRRMLSGPTFLYLDLSGWCTINSMVTGPSTAIVIGLSIS
jgi:surface protein